MSKKSSLLLISFALMLAIFVFTGCAKPVKEEERGEKPAAEEKKAGEPTRNDPLVVDEENGVVKIYTEVNGKTFTESTRHGVVFKDGKNGQLPILRAYANQNDFHDALERIGAEPGNKLTLESKPGTTVQGDTLTVKVSWNGETRDFSEIVRAEPDRGFEVRFGGNEDRAKDKFSGCILCLDSCPVGITSNAGWAFGDWQAGKVKFFGVEDVLPPDGSAVIASFSLQ